MEATGDRTIFSGGDSQEQSAGYMQSLTPESHLLT